MLRFESSRGNQSEPKSFPAREALLELRIQKLFASSHAKREAGLATILSAPPHFAPLIGNRIYFSLETEDQIQAGESYEAFAVLRPLEIGNAFSLYLQDQSVAYRFVQGELRQRLEDAPWLDRKLHAGREALASMLGRNKLPQSEFSGAYKAMMLGQKRELSPEQKDLFLANGAMHLFAISGLHIGIIAACIHHLLTLLRVPRKYRPVATLLAVLSFVMVTGGSASSWRALLMIACLYLSQWGKRQASPLNALALSALIYLLILPDQLFQAGFQMSYLTVAAILLLGLPLADTLNRSLPLFAGIPVGLQTWLERKTVKAKTWLCNAVAISAAAFTTSSLLGAYYFQILPVYGVVTNLFALPTASLAIVAGFLSIVCSPLSSIVPLSELFNNAAIVLIALIHGFLDFCVTLPGASIDVAPFSSGILAACLGAVMSLCLLSYAKTGQKRVVLWQATPLIATGASLVLIANR